jgi:RimJ/RimL family protein N-acetyltransferase
LGETVGFSTLSFLWVLATSDKMQPSFTTARLILRPRLMQDLAACVAMDDDPLVVRFLDVPWSDATSHRAFVRSRINHRYAEGLGYWSVFRRDDADAFLGWILLTPLDLIGPEIEIGWRFTRAAWGKGYATEAATPVLRHGFETLGLAEIVADIDPANTASLRVAEKIGLRPDDTGPRPTRRYALTRDVYRHAT